MNIPQKYFLALLPPDDLLLKVESIKQELKEKFGIKYAFKSPAHITLKMPFPFKEAKEDELVKKVSSFLSNQNSFPVILNGVGNFGNRVVFMRIEKSPDLEILQASLRSFCKRQLHLVEELSDRNYHPHMTVAFQDVKPAIFSEVLDFVRSREIRADFEANHLVLLKKIEGRWVDCRRIPFGISE